LKPNHAREDRPTPDSGRQTPDSAIRAFFDQWHLYELLIRHDYMAHRGIHRALRASLEEFPRSPFSVMDLGCGDASVVARTLSGLPVSKYVGVDLSEIVLEMAAERFAGAAYSVELVACSLGDYIARPETERVDVIIAGFAVHHLRDDEKAAFFSDCFGKLNPCGDLYLFDVFRQEGQSRAEYLDSYCAVLESEWASLSSEQKSSISEHIRTFDFPVPYETMRGFARPAGFEAPARAEFTDSSGLHRLYRFQVRK
jgi:SAM-dependent methyltransferase